MTKHSREDRIESHESEISKLTSTTVAVEDWIQYPSGKSLAGPSSPLTNFKSLQSSPQVIDYSSINLFNPVAHFDVIMRLYSCYKLSLEVLFLGFDLLRRASPILAELA